MHKKTVLILSMVVVLPCLALTFFPKKSHLFYEEFDSESLGKQGAETDTPAGADVLVKAGKSTLGTVISKNGMLCLSTGASERTGGGQWRRPVDMDVGPDTALAWEWAAYDAGEYQLWLKIRFNNHRSIYYQASDSKPPGRYEGGVFNAYKGEIFSDKDGRLRFLPSVCILVNPPGTAWTKCKRTISKDYSRTYGDMPAHLAISEIVIGMFDDSTVKANALGIEYIMIEDR